MEKSVLVLLLCLQAFLFITALDAADAAPWLTGNRQRKPGRAVPRRRPWFGYNRYCYLRPGACSLLVKPKPKDDGTKSPIANI